MKTYKHLFEQMVDKENIKECIYKASKGKRDRAYVKTALDNIDFHAENLKWILENREYHFRHYDPVLINSASERKERLIAKPYFLYDQVMHHVLMSVFIPIVTKSLYAHVYGSIPKRGPHKAKKYLERWIRSYGNKRFYVLKCDIKHFYDSIDHNALKQKLQKKINDQKYLDILFSLIDSYEPGLAKGFYTSQWLANFYLEDFDRFIKEELGVKHYMRYMDDIVILYSNKRKLHRIKDRIDEFLQDKLKLRLKENWQVYRFVDRNDENGRDIDFMGFRFFRNKTTLRKSNLRRIRRKANKIGKKRKAGQRITIHDCQSMLAYLGWTKHTDVYNYYQEWIKPNVNKRELRKKVSRADKAKNKK